MTGFHLHPTMLDSVLQTAGAMLLFHKAISEKRGIYLPVSIERMHSWRRWPELVYAHVNLRHFQETSLVVDIEVYDENGIEVAEIINFRTRYVEDARNVEDDMYNCIWEEKKFIGAGSELDNKKKND